MKTGVKGAPKTPGSGRKKGTPNKSSLNARQIMEKAGFNPIRRMMALAKDESVEAHIRAQMVKELAKYHSPQLKAIEISGNPEKPLEVRDADARQKRIKELEHRMNGHEVEI